MSAQYNTDGLFTFPTETHPITMNALESVECTIAFDVKDWREDRRSAWIYLIVFGWDEETDEVAGKFGWDLQDIERGNLMHQQWERAKEFLLKFLAAEQPKEET